MAVPHRFPSSWRPTAEASTCSLEFGGHCSSSASLQRAQTVFLCLKKASVTRGKLERPEPRGRFAEPIMTSDSNLSISKNLQDREMVLGDKGTDPGYSALLICALSRGASSSELTSVPRGQRPPAPFSYLSALGWVTIVPSLDHVDKLKISHFFPLNSWLAILHNNTKFLLK